MSNTNPSSPPQFTALAERCEQAKGPDRVLDIEIVVATDWREPDWEEGERTAKELADRHGVGWLAERAEGGMTVWRHLPRFTASLDAAMTLVPEGFDWIIGRTNGGLTVHAEVGGRGNEFMRFGNTPALALCAAALRAKDQS